ncbi:MAG: hypothetical protein AAFY06_00230 [Pseudomonadota bacterium]
MPTKKYGFHPDGNNKLFTVESDEELLPEGWFESPEEAAAAGGGAHPQTTEGATGSTQPVPQSGPPPVPDQSPHAQAPVGEPPKPGGIRDVLMAAGEGLTPEPNTSAENTQPTEPNTASDIDDIQVLRAELERRNIAVDKRWGVQRLKQVLAGLDQDTQNGNS